MRVKNDLFYFTLIENFATKEECDHLILLTDNKLKRATVGNQYESSVSDVRTNSHCWFDRNHDSIIYKLCHRIADAVEIPFTHTEQLQLLKYEKGQEYKPHYDAAELDSEGTVKSIAGWGQRLKTALLYLNDVTNGGETFFPKSGIKIPPKQGRLLIFNNIDIEHPEFPLFESLHGSSPVKEGTKWACNLWFRQNKSSLRKNFK